ncbi:MAG: efflux RND transporter periplasmic adaptor subunit [Candidatus Thiodiazotropha taylori]|nr:efflux RND transporter periplasmic adaptor subunit [Candidatus Thiodiazotropha taylori]RLW54396.1 MAG: efflux transporter periplasmic adaptor subunit [gamma proteobacterium symbiont of Stewartia floridana]MCG7924663.1 efflux RND transporter periplasmic adaptor subunit [Candidatus Thiodiazotropha taylori]MCG7934752.1 efflux RND transporter periplasmic adaptor subunit [Candidatus Thiodiazotropha taylori]MCG8073398.1 efflux RND transporter periplasmic adaptor subunit [Candidatus Thiodiazotropha
MSDHSSIWRKLLVIPPILLGIGVLMVMVGNKQPPTTSEAGEPTKRVRVVEAPQLALTPVAEGYGTIQPARVWSAVAQVSGRIVELHPRLRNGEIITKETLLLKIDPVDYELNLAQVSAELAELKVEENNVKASLSIEQRSLKIAERELQRITKLTAKGTASQSDLDNAERNLLNSRNAVQNVKNSLALMPTRLKVLEAKKRQAERDLENTSVYAPFNMRVADMGIEIDQFVSKGGLLLAGDEVDRVEVVARFPMSSLRRLFIGRDVSEFEMLGGNLAEAVAFEPLLRLDLGTTIAEWQAEFVRFSDKVDPDTRTMGVVVAVDRPFEKVIPGQRPPLSKGMFVQVLLKGKTQADRIILPRSTIKNGVVYLADENNRLQRQPVEILYNQGDISVIGKGIQAGQRVVISDLVPAVSGMLLQTVPDQQMEALLQQRARGQL